VRPSDRIGQLVLVGAFVLCCAAIVILAAGGLVAVLRVLTGRSLLLALGVAVVIGGLGLLARGKRRKDRPASKVQITEGKVPKWERSYGQQ